MVSAIFPAASFVEQVHARLHTILSLPVIERTIPIYKRMLRGFVFVWFICCACLQIGYLEYDKEREHRMEHGTFKMELD